MYMINFKWWESIRDNQTRFAFGFMKCLSMNLIIPKSIDMLLKSIISSAIKSSFIFLSLNKFLCLKS